MFTIIQPDIEAYSEKYSSPENDILKQGNQS